MRPMTGILAAFALAALCAPCGAQVSFAYDFEAGDDLAAYEGLGFSNAEGRIVPGGADGTGHALQLTTPRPGRYCTLRITRPMTMQKNLVLSFDHRAEIEEGKQAGYLGVLFFDAEGKQWFGMDKFGPEWKRAEIIVGELHSPNEGVLYLDKPLSHVNIYGRAQGDTEAHMTVWLDNIRLEVMDRAGRLSDAIRVSTANPPLFNWPRGEGPMRLQYSLGADFPPDETVTVETRRSFHTPPAPLEPGMWHWRVWTETEFVEGWSDTHRVEVPPEAHRFTTPSVPEEEIARRPHPRVITTQFVDDDDRRAALINRARSLAQTGVPDDPPPYEPGNPEWPTWIDWYGKVHGGITSATGRRLQQMSEVYVQTRDEEVRELLREMTMKAASWDPDGGSAMGRGDIGAHHFLRGLTWCYDALRDDLTPEELHTLREIIVVRAEQFWRRLNPFRGGEYNNHSWLQTFGLAETGFVLLGEHDEAGEWAEFGRQLYIGRFLCALGYQGENNEGIAYWGYGLWFVIDYADMMRHVCDYDLFRHPWLNQTARFPMYTAPPGAWAVSFANTGQPNHGVRGPSQATHVRNLALRTRDPYALWYSGAQGEVEGLLPRPPADLPQSIHYRHIGWVLHNTSIVDGREGVTFAMRSGPFYAGHQHEDQNGFVIHAYGEKLAIDSGHYDWYGSEHFKHYATLTRAHNAILVNEKDQNSRRAGADGNIAAYFDSPAYGYSHGEVANPLIYDGELERWDRRALFIKPGFVVIHDALEAADGPARYDWLLHTVAPIETDEPTGAFSLTSGGAALRGRFLLPGDLALDVTKGYPVEPVDRYSTRPVPPERYVDEWTLTATPAEPRQGQAFLTAMQIQRLADNTPDAAFEALETQNGEGVRIAMPDETHLVAFRDAGAEGTLAAGGLATDGAVASVSVPNAGGNTARALAVGAGFLRWENAPLLQSPDTPVDFSLMVTPEGALVHLALPQAGRVLLPAAGARDTVLVNGDPVETPRLEGGLVALDLPAGEHEVAWGAGPARARSHDLPPLVMDGAGLEGFAQRHSEGLLSHWWGRFEAPEADRYDLLLEGWDGAAPPHVNCNGQPLQTEPQDGALRATLWLDRGSHSLTIVGRGSLSGVRLDALGTQMGRAQMLPADFRPDPADILVEAEHVALEGEVKGRVMEKVGASGGLEHCVWDTDGQWAEWVIPVAEAGVYELLVRGASEYDNILRLLHLDGEPLAPGLEVVRFRGTGGFCRTRDDCRYHLISDADGAPLHLRLSPGEHRLRMERVTGSMNLDCFILRRAGE